MRKAWGDSCWCSEPWGAIRELKEHGKFLSSSKHAPMPPQQQSTTEGGFYLVKGRRESGLSCNVLFMINNSTKCDIPPFKRKNFTSTVYSKAQKLFKSPQMERLFVLKLTFQNILKTKKSVWYSFYE